MSESKESGLELKGPDDPKADHSHPQGTTESSEGAITSERQESGRKLVTELHAQGAAAVRLGGAQMSPSANYVSGKDLAFMYIHPESSTELWDSQEPSVARLRGALQEADAAWEVFWAAESEVFNAAQSLKFVPDPDSDGEILQAIREVERIVDGLLRPGIEPVKHTFQLRDKLEGLVRAIGVLNQVPPEPA